VPQAAGQVGGCHEAGASHGGKLLAAQLPGCRHPAAAPAVKGSRPQTTGAGQLQPRRCSEGWTLLLQALWLGKPRRWRRERPARQFEGRWQLVQLSHVVRLISRWLLQRLGQLQLQCCLLPPPPLLLLLLLLLLLWCPKVVAQHRAQRGAALFARRRSLLALGWLPSWRLLSRMLLCRCRQREQLLGRRYRAAGREHLC